MFYVCVVFFFFRTWSLVSLGESPCLFEIYSCFLLEFLGLRFGLVGLYCLARRYWTSHNDAVYSPWTIQCNCMGKPPTKSECKCCNSFLVCCYIYIYTRVFLLRLYLFVCLFSRRSIHLLSLNLNYPIAWVAIYIHILFIAYKKKKKKKIKKQRKRTEANWNDNTW